MSTISSNADVNTKYQRIATEYAKLKVQVAALKSAVINEQDRCQKLATEFHSSQASLRKLQTEKEGLEFRNAQLLKRVESLQGEVGNDYRHSSAKKRNAFFQIVTKVEPSKQELDIFQSELQAKVAENESLHKKITEMIAESDRVVTTFSEERRKLEAEISSLKDENMRLAGGAATIAAATMSEKRIEERFCDQYSHHRHIGDSMLQSTHYSADANSTEVFVSHETFRVLWLDALRTARALATGFGNLLQLFEQRSTIYPNDINLEKLPERTLLFARYLLSSCDKFEACSSGIEAILVKNSEEECDDLLSECSKITTVIIDAVQSCKKWQPLFIECNMIESRLSWCSNSLFKCNCEWSDAFVRFLDSLYALSRMIDNVNEKADSKDLYDHTEHLLAEALGCCNSYSAKLFNENHIPTATKRLRCVNECIRKCLVTLHRNFKCFLALLQLVIGTNLAPVKCENGSGDERNVHSYFGPKNSIDQCTLTESCDFATQEVLDAYQEVPQRSYNFARNELDMSKKRIIELEKEKERISVEVELLKAKLEVVRSHSSNSDERCTATSAAEAENICALYQGKLGELYTDLEYARSRALYYKFECKDLLKIVSDREEENRTLQNELKNMSDLVISLKEDLETTRKSYELQLQNLHEHLADLNLKLTDRSISQKPSLDVPNGLQPAKNFNTRKSLFK